MTDDKSKNRIEWYKKGRWDDLEQGDLLPACPILSPPDDLASLLKTVTPGKTIEIASHIDYTNLIIATQTCDLQPERKTENVLLCGYSDATNYDSQVQKEVLKGKRVAHYMLPNCDLRGRRFNNQIVDFRAVYSLPIQFVREFAQELGIRIRINSPYKEHFASAFGNIFTRVALPRNLSNL